MQNSFTTELCYRQTCWSDLRKRSALLLELSTVLNCFFSQVDVACKCTVITLNNTDLKTRLTFHLIFRQANRGPVGEDIWNSAKSLVHEPGGHSTHWHFCEGKPTTVSRSSQSLALRSFETDPLLLSLIFSKQNMQQMNQEAPSAKCNPASASDIFDML